MELKSLVYSRTSSSQPVLRIQQEVPAFKSLVYSRTELSASSQLEGTSFESQFRSVPSKLQTVLCRSDSLPALLHICVLLHGNDHNHYISLVLNLWQQHLQGVYHRTLR